MIKFEVVISAWDDGLFRGIERFNADEIEDINSIFSDTLDSLEKKIREREEEKRKIMEDDDIPF